MKGIDVSKWQGNIDWEKVKSDNIEFAMIRSSWGKKSPTQIDKKFKQNLHDARENGIFCGAYHYTYADSVQDAIDEANWFIDNIDGEKFEFPVVLDIEDRTLLSLTTQQRTKICETFCNKIENSRYYVMIYCSLDWYLNKILGEYLSKKYDFWIASWSENKSLVVDSLVRNKVCGIWQYSEKGSVNGISGNVDLDISYKNYPEIIKNNNLNGFSKIIIEKIKKGDRVKVLKNVQYGTNERFNVFFTNYDVISANGDRIVIGRDNIVTAAVDAGNLELLDD